MAQSHYVLDKSFKAATDLSANQYCFVKLGANEGEVTLCDTLGEFAVGVLQNKPKAGQQAAVRLLGTSKVVANAAITRGAFITAAATGKAVGTTTAGHHIRALALEAATAVNEIKEFYLVNFKY